MLRLKTIDDPLNNGQYFWVSSYQKVFFLQIQLNLNSKFTIVGISIKQLIAADCLKTCQMLVRLSMVPELLGRSNGNNNISLTLGNIWKDLIVTGTFLHDIPFDDFIINFIKINIETFFGQSVFKFLQSDIGFRDAYASRDVFFALFIVFI